MSCLDLTLPKPVSNTKALPIFVHTQHLFKSTWSYGRHTVSDGGYVRGLLFIEAESPDFGPSAARKFIIDASGEECTIAVSDPYPIYLLTGMEVDYGVAFDSTRGRTHYIELENTVNRVVAADLA